MIKNNTKYSILYQEENEFRKLERSFKKYLMLAYKEWEFGKKNELLNGNFIDIVEVDKQNSIYRLPLTTDNVFSKLYGEINIVFKLDKKKHTITLLEITPSDILLKGYFRELLTYKNVWIADINDSCIKFKIDTILKLYDKKESR